jgi:hypothetical protein
MKSVIFFEFQIGACHLAHLLECKLAPPLDDFAEENVVRVLKGDHLEDVSSFGEGLLKVEEGFESHEADEGSYGFEVHACAFTVEPFGDGERVVAYQPEHDMQMVVFKV